MPSSNSRSRFGEMLDEAPIVGDEQDGAFVILKQLFKGFDRLDIEEIGRLVKHQNVHIADEDFGEGDLDPFAAAQHADGFVHGFAEEVQTGEHRADQRFILRKCREHCPKIDRVIQDVDVLAEIAEPGQMERRRSGHSVVSAS